MEQKNKQIKQDLSLLLLRSVLNRDGNGADAVLGPLREDATEWLLLTPILSSSTSSSLISDAVSASYRLCIALGSKSTMYYSKPNIKQKYGKDWKIIKCPEKICRCFQPLIGTEGREKEREKARALKRGR